MTDISPERLLAIVADRVGEKSATLMVFWHRVTGDRSQCLRAIKAVRGDTSIVPLIVRDGFANANAIHADLSELIEVNRAEFEEVRPPFTVSSPLVIVLLARTDLGVPQISSPAVLPEWLPGLGGTSAEVVIENLVTAALAPINAPEARIEEIVAALFELEGEMLVRLKAVLDSDHKKGNAFFEAIRDRESGETYRVFLDTAEECHKSVQHASAFRPSAAEGSALVGRFLRVVSGTAPDGLHAISQALAGALKFDGEDKTLVKDSFPAVLFRSTVRDTDRATRLARNLLISVFASAQFATSAAHADDYPAFLVVLLQGMSYNLRETLQDLTQHIRSLDAPPPRVIPEEYRR